MGRQGFDWKAFYEIDPLDPNPPLAPSSFGLQLLAVDDATGAIQLIGAEPALGNPASDGYVLSSTAAGVRSWISIGSGAIGTVTSVGITQPAAGITATGGPITTTGSITLALANDLAAIEALGGTGYPKRTGVDAWSISATIPWASLSGIDQTLNTTNAVVFGSVVLNDNTVRITSGFVGAMGANAKIGVSEDDAAFPQTYLGFEKVHALFVELVDQNSADFNVTIYPLSATALTAHRNLIIDVGNASRTIAFTGDPTLSGITTTGTGTLALGTKTLTISQHITLTTDGTGTRTLNVGAGGTLGTAAFTAATAYAIVGAITGSGLTMATAKLLGRSTASTGAIEEITVGSGLSLSGGTLSASGAGGSGDVVGPASAGDGKVALFDGTTGKIIKDSGLALAGSNSGDVTLAGENYISLSSQVITASAVNLSGTHVTGTLAAGRFPALSGDITTSAGSLATTIGANKVTLGMLATLAANSVIGNSTGSTATPTAVAMVSTNTASAVVIRDGSGNFAAGTITAALTGNASTATALATARAIYGNNFDGTAALTQIIASTFGGTGNGFTKFSGPTTAERTKTLRDATDTILELGGSYTPTGTWTSLTLVTPALGTPASGNLTNCTFPTLNQSTTGTAAIATTITAANEATDTTCFPVFVTAATGNLGPKTHASLTFNSNTVSLACTTFVGALTGNASTATALATTRAIYGNNFDGSAALTQIIASTYGGTGNGFTKFSGPTTAERTKTLRDATDTILELGGSYTPTGTWTSLTMVTPVLGTPTSGTLTNCTGLPVAGITASTSTAIGVGSVELGHATDTTVSRSAAGVIAVEGVVIPSISSTNTLTNKRITKRSLQSSNDTTFDIDTDLYDYAEDTGLTGGVTVTWSGTPTLGQTLWVSFTGTASRAITWDTDFEASTVALPTTTSSTARLDVGFIWNSATSKFRCVAVA